MTVVQPGLRRAQEIPYGSSGTIYAWAERDGVLQNPTSATVNIYADGAVDTKTISAASATEDADHKLSYILDASTTSTWPLGTRWTAEFNCVIASQTPNTIIKRTFMIVRTPMVHNPPLRVDDLYNANRNVEKNLGNASITDASYFIVEAWEEILSWCEQHGKIPGYIANPDVLVPMLRARARQLMFSALSQTTDDLNSKLAKDWGEKFADVMVNPSVLEYSPADSRSLEQQPGAFQPRVTVSGRAIGDSRIGWRVS